jgi:predicted phage terminase large subunit-like protein
MEVHTKRTNRLLITQPPRSLKSTCVSIAYVAWLLGHNPTRRIIVVSYSNDLAADLHRHFRMIIEAPWYRALFPAMRLAKDTDTEVVTSVGGGRYATSIGGTLTGRGADLIVIDDPLKAEDAGLDLARKRVVDWFCGTLVPRVNDKERGPIIVVSQRLHEADLAGHLLEQGHWRHLELQAIADESARLSYPDLRREVANLAERYGAEFILIEDAGPGMSLLQDLRQEPPPGMNRPIGIKPQGSKGQRMAAQSFKLQDGRVYLPKQAHWLEEFLRELLAFPNGKHDDQVDSLSQFLNWAAKRRYFETQSFDVALVY